MRRPATTLLVASGVAVVSSGAVASVAATGPLRAGVVLAVLAALVSFAVFVLRREERVLVGSLALLGLAAAIALWGPVNGWRVGLAALDGLLVLVAAELARWSRLFGAGQTSTAGTAPEVRRKVVLTGLAGTGLAGLTGGALGFGLVGGRGGLAGFGLAALTLGVAAGVGLVLLFGAAGQTGEHRARPTE